MKNEYSFRLLTASVMRIACYAEALATKAKFVTLAMPVKPQAWRLAWLAGLLWLGAVGLFAAEDLASDANLIRNSGFEDLNDSGTPAGWKVEAQDAESKCDTTVKADGGKSLRLALSADANGRGHATVESAYFPVEGGKTYLLTFLHKAEGWPEGRGYEVAWSGFRLLLRDRNGKPMQLNNTAFDLGFRDTKNKDWERGLWVFTAPAEAGSAALTLVFHGAGKDALAPRVWFDNVRMRAWKTQDVVLREYHDEAVARLQGHPKPAEGVEVVTEKSDDGSQYQVLRFEKGHKAWGMEASHVGALPKGEYTVAYRLKVADNTSDDVAFLVRTEMGGMPGGFPLHVIRVKDFKTPNTWQEFSYDFVRALPSAYVIQRLCWDGKATAWFDYVTVIQRKAYTEKDIEDLWRAVK